MVWMKQDEGKRKALFAIRQTGSRQIENDHGRVLIVEDERSISYLFMHYVQSTFPGVSVDVANNGAQALQTYGERHHGLWVLDLRIPVMDGESAFVGLRDKCRREGREMPQIVFCTTNMDSRSIVDAMSSSPSRFSLLLKPVTYITFAEALGRHLRISSQGLRARGT